MNRGAIAIGLATLLFSSLFSCQSADAANPSLLELRVGKTKYRGKVIAKNNHFCWLMDREGQLNSIKLKSVSSFQKVSARFRGFTAADMRIKLMKEFGKGFEVSGTQHYLVCAQKGHAKQYAQLFEQIYRTFYMYFRTRRFEISKPEFPMVAIVFPTHSGFARYCSQDGVQASKTLRGYYLRTSNRVALYASGKESLVWNDSQPAPFSTDLFGCDCGGNKYSSGPFRMPLNRSRPNGTPVNQPNIQQLLLTFERVNGSLRDTIIHEATHQVAFNTGLHVRIGPNPK